MHVIHTFILIASMYTHGVATVEFDSQGACEVAGNALVRENMSPDFICVDKG